NNDLEAAEKRLPGRKSSKIMGLARFVNALRQVCRINVANGKPSLPVVTAPAGTKKYRKRVCQNCRVSPSYRTPICKWGAAKVLAQASHYRCSRNRQHD